MDEQQEQQQDRFKQAVDEKSAQAREQAEQTSAEAHSEQPNKHDRPQGVVDPRTKNSGKGQKTADKWNQ
jgi:hypothetical protein